MKCSELWLREWVNLKLSTNALCHALTMAGLEVESQTPCIFSENISQEAENAIQISRDANINEANKTYLTLEDNILDISITPNRGDCLSIKGLAREISSITHDELIEYPIKTIEATITETLPVYIEAKKACPRYLGRIIKKINANKPTPLWLKEKLFRSGIRSINIIVDAANFVMLELGQPMHAFDLSKINREICVRFSKTDESITLLDESTKILDNKTLLIADSEKPLAIAGVMGSLDSGVSLLTKDIFLESAYFDPETIARQRQYYQLNSDAAYRFERGVDYNNQMQFNAIERLTQLILELSGGEAGPITEVINQDYLPISRQILLPYKLIEKVLGITLDKNIIEKIFNALHFNFKFKNESWLIDVPSYRFDLTIPEDIIEEIARLYGYDKIPTHQMFSHLKINDDKWVGNQLSLLKNKMCHQGYHEVITYSFIDKESQKLIDPDQSAKRLLNPLTEDMEVMRTSLWSGLIKTMLFNLSRQQSRIKIFELGTCFKEHGEEMKLGLLATGLCYPESWGQTKRNIHFFDVKGHLQNIFDSLHFGSNITFKSSKHPYLHPGRTADIFLYQQKIGVIGDLHPSIKQAISVNNDVILAEIDYKSIENSELINLKEVSKFPEIRRDIAILVNQTIPASDISDTIKAIAGDWLKELFIFDVYSGKGIPSMKRSLALGLIFQHATRTLVDDEVNNLMERIVEALKRQWGAELRS